MSKIFETQFNKGSYISRQEDVGVNTLGVFKRTEKGLAWTSIGVSENIAITMPALSRNSATIFAWVKLNRIDNSQFILGNITQHTFQYWGLRGSNDLNCECNINGQYWSLGTDFSANYNKWTHVMLVADSGTVTTYWNNIAVDTETPSADLTFNLIGKGGLGYWLNGSIAKVAMYDHPFTATERSQAYEEFLQANASAVEKTPRYNPHSKPTDLSNEVGLVAAYNMIPQGSTLVDISGSGNNGTINGPISSLDGLIFDGVDDYVTRTQLSEISVSTSFTVVCRIKLKDLTPKQIIWGNGKLVNDRVGLILEASNLSFETYNGADFLGKKHIGITEGIYNIVCVGVNNSQTLYINGVEVTNSAVNAELGGTTSDFTIGSSLLGTDRWFDGEIEDIKIYNYAFTEQQAKDYHNSFAKRVVLWEAFEYDAAGSTLPRGWTPGTGAYEIKELAAQDSVLKHLDVGTKYLECTSAGTIAIPSKAAYGTWEWDWYQAVTTNQPTVLFVNNKIADWVTSPGSYTLLIVNPDRDVRFYENTSSKSITAKGYVAATTWYRMKVTRTKDGEFYCYIKGGDFGANWVLIDVSGGSGDNPITSNGVTTSEYFAVNLDVGDYIANIVIKEGVWQ